MTDKTTISIEKETLEKLKTFKLVNRESYDEILCRLMKNEENTKDFLVELSRVRMKGKGIKGLKPDQVYLKIWELIDNTIRKK